MPAWNLRGMLATATAVDILPYRQPASLGSQWAPVRPKLCYISKIYGVYGNLAMNPFGNKASLSQYAKQERTAGTPSPPHDSATGQRQGFQANKNPAATQSCRVL
jgi:hypothetical protein